MKVAPCDVPVHHMGKLNRARVTEKGVRYFELGMKKIEESGGTPRAIFELAIQAGELGRYDDAVDLWRRFLNGDPGQEVRRAYVNLINACLNADRFDEALVEARKAEAIANGTRELLLNCAAAEFFAGDLRKAATRAQKLLQKNPDYPPALGLLAMSLALTGKEERSVDVLHRLQGAGLETRSQLLPAVEKLRIAGKEEQADRLERLEAESCVTYPCLKEGDPGQPVVFIDRFPTASGKAKFVPADIIPAAEQPDAEYPLVLITGRQLEHWHTGAMTRRAGVLDAIEPDAVATLHPLELARIGVQPGEVITVKSRRGSVSLYARADDGTPPGAVFIPFCYYEAAANLLTNPALDPSGKIPEFKYCAVAVHRGGELTTLSSYGGGRSASMVA